MNTINPAIVTARAAQRLPRLALWSLCAAYLLPGLLGRDPWKSADITAFGYMLSLAQGHGSWLMPTLGGLPAKGAVLPYWLGAVFIQWLPWVEPALAARIPFALLLGTTMWLTWRSTFHLARTSAAQPLAFAFGGEAQPLDYARALADGALLALIASLGLLQLGHETTPELVQLTALSLWVYALASQRAFILALSLPIMAASGAPYVALTLSLLALGLSIYTPHRRMALSACAAGVLAFLIAWRLHGWHAPWHLPTHVHEVALMGRQLIWFLWPTWPLALFTLWRWRARLWAHHVLVPLSCTLVALLASTAIGGHDRTLMLALPTLAILAAFALPTLGRSTAAAIDWFSVFFFSGSALMLWVMYGAMLTGFPPKPAANMVRLAAGFTPQFSVWATALSLAGTLAWIGLVRWRTSAIRHPLWKSLVLPAGGVALSWLMVMTLWLPLLDYRRSYRPLIERIQAQVPHANCVATVGVERAQLAALAYFGHYTIDATSTSEHTPCEVLMRKETTGQHRSPDPPGWRLVARVHRPADKTDVTVIYRKPT